MTTTAHDLLTLLRTDLAVAQNAYTDAMSRLTLEDLGKPQPALHAAFRRHQDIATAIIEVERVMGVKS